MGTKLIVFIFLVMVFECNGHLSILGDIVSTARERVHSTVEGIAGAVLGGFNIGAHIGFNAQKNHQNVPQKDSDETIIVVVEEPDSNINNNGPTYHGQRPHHHHQGPHGDNRPGYNYHEGPNNQNGNHQYPGNQGNGENSNNGHNNQNGYPYDNQFNPQPTRPHDYQQNNNYPTNGDNVNVNTNQFPSNPTTEYVKTSEQLETSTLPNEDAKNKGTEKSNDAPLFVPLNPDEYVYGGDKINITAPKRDTDKSNEESDYDYAIDARFKNE